MELNARIQKARTDAGMTQEALAAAVGKTRGAVSQWESGEVHPRPSTLAAIARATNKPLIWLQNGIDGTTTGLVVVGEVAGGVWREANLEYVRRGVPVAPHPDYPAEFQRLYQVRGNSVNLAVRDGEYVHCVMSEATTIQPGDLVVVSRERHGLSEYTVKRYIVDGKKKILRPESDDPSCQEDVAIEGDEDTVIRITDVVLAKWSPIRRGF